MYIDYIHILMRNLLDQLIDNTRENARITGEQQKNIKHYRSILINQIDYILQNIFGLDSDRDYEIINQGSYATFTQIYIPDNTDFDIDIGINFNSNTISNVPENPQHLRDILFAYIDTNPIIK